MRICVVNLGKWHYVLDMSICNFTWFYILSHKNIFCSYATLTCKRQTINQKMDLWDYQLLKVRKFDTWGKSHLSIWLSNWFQNLNQSKWALSNIIMSNLGKLVFQNLLSSFLISLSRLFSSSPSALLGFFFLILISSEFFYLLAQHHRLLSLYSM